MLYTATENHPYKNQITAQSQATLKKLVLQSGSGTTHLETRFIHEIAHSGLTQILVLKAQEWLFRDTSASHRWVSCITHPVPLEIHSHTATGHFRGCRAFLTAVNSLKPWGLLR